MSSLVYPNAVSGEVYTRERCFLAELWNCLDDPGMSVARARVVVGETTAWHALDGVSERYMVICGEGEVEVGDAPPVPIATGDVVLVPAGERQRVRSIGRRDLEFYCFCTPRFTPQCYRHLEDDGDG